MSAGVPAVAHSYHLVAKAGSERRRPEESVLYQMVEIHWPRFLEKAEEAGGLPKFVKFDSALRLNVHFHSLFLDGVYMRADDGELEFLELPEPSPQQVEEVARRTAKRIAELLEKAGKSLDPEMVDSGEDEFAVLVGGRTPPSPSSGMNPDSSPHGPHALRAHLSFAAVL